MSSSRRSKKNFFILGPGRCRTAWLSAFLTQGNIHCWHEASRLASSSESFHQYMSRSPASIIGNSDSGICFNIGWFLDHYPDARFLLIHRPMLEVKRSFESYFKRELPQTAWSKLAQHYKDACERLSGKGCVVTFKQLEDESILREVWSYCTFDAPWNPQRHALFKALVIQAPQEYDLSYQSGFQRELQQSHKEQCLHS